jgi:4-hydroxybenzoate polyprenyltransferase
MPWLLVQWEQYPEKSGATWNAFLWGHNWMFITVLCILFDIKDYAADHNRQLKTFVVRVGLRRVIYSIVWPLVVTGMVALFAFMLLREFSLAGMVMNVLPMIALLMVTQSMQQRRPIEYFLVAIDGLMIVKALFGMLSYLML